nr:hypothetical protein GCM10025732_13270 [Glycomyces mayteni]
MKKYTVTARIANIAAVRYSAMTIGSAQEPRLDQTFEPRSRTARTANASGGAMPYVVARLSWFAASYFSAGRRFGTAASFAGDQMRTAPSMHSWATASHTTVNAVLSVMR